MSSKHRAPRRTQPHLTLVLAATAVIVMAAAVVLLWPPGPEPTAAGEQVSTAGEPELEVAPLPDFDRIVFYGHSMPTGGGASEPELGYADLTAEATGLQLLNRAEGGTMAGTAANTMAAFPPAGPRDMVVIHTGMNDIFRRGDDAAVMGRESVRRLLSGTSGAERRVLVLECQPDSWLDTPPQVDRQRAYEAWNEMLREEAARAPGVEVLDSCAEWDPKSYTDIPKYHPNDAGHALIAKELVALLQGS